MEETKDTFITGEELAKFSFLQHKRDMEIQQLGLNTYAMQLSIDAAKININNLIEEQKVLGKLILSNYGFDPDKEYTIDLQTGKIMPGKS